MGVQRGKMFQYDSQILKLYQDGIGRHKIAKIIGCDPKSVANRGKVLGIDFSINSKFRTYFRQHDRLKDLCLLLNNNVNTVDIIKTYGYFPNEVLTSHYYGIDENFFNVIDHEVKAYSLGMFYADGNVSHNKYGYRVSICVTDYEIVNNIKYVMQYSGPIRTVTRMRNGQTQKKIYELDIKRKKLYLDLVDNGCVPNKSLILKFPSPDIVPQTLLPHFIRGWFDGDGCISFYERFKRWTTPLVGTYDFLEGVCNTCDIDGNWKKLKNQLTYSLVISRKDYIIKFINYMYKDATMILPRKAIKCDMCLDYFCRSKSND